jgi:diguanylate cyclase (GGDEF)-like protein
LIGNNKYLIEPYEHKDIDWPWDKSTDNSRDEEKWLVMSLIGQQEKILGKFIVSSKKFPPSSQEIIMIFMQQIAAATENKLLTNELEKQANTDGLTKIYNRALFDREFESIKKLSQQHATLHFAILMLDINGLKKVNDNFGHEKGDEMIIKTAEMIKHTCRTSDIPVRLGGDELLLLCPATNYQSALGLIKRIRKAEEGMILECMHANGEIEQVPIHISIGVAASDETAIDEVLKSSDKRMYQDKEDYYKTREKYR